jgi:hypothetical protein
MKQSTPSLSMSRLRIEVRSGYANDGVASGKEAAAAVVEAGEEEVSYETSGVGAADAHRECSVHSESARVRYAECRRHRFLCSYIAAARYTLRLCAFCTYDAAAPNPAVDSIGSE